MRRGKIEDEYKVVLYHGMILSSYFISCIIGWRLTCGGDEALDQEPFFECQ